MAEHMRRDIDPGFPADLPEQVVHIRIVHGFPGILSLDLHEHVVRWRTFGMEVADVLCEHFHQVICTVERPRA